MLRFHLFTFLAMLFAVQEGVKTPLPTSTQPIEKSSAVEPPEQVEAKITAEVAEIMAIRKQLGGGISERLKGISIEMPGGKKLSIPDAKPTLTLEQRFAETLAAQSKQNYTATKQLAKVSLHPISPKVSPTPKSLDNEQCKSIRRAARMLEEAAAILEDSSQYDQADRVRQTAVELWRSARNQ